MWQISLRKRELIKRIAFHLEFITGTPGYWRQGQGHFKEKDRGRKGAQVPMCKSSFNDHFVTTTANVKIYLAPQIVV